MEATISHPQRPRLDSAHRVFQVLGFFILGMNAFFFGMRLYLRSHPEIPTVDLVEIPLLGGGNLILIFALFILALVNHGLRIWRLDSRVFYPAVLSLAMFAFTLNRSMGPGDGVAGNLTTSFEILIHLSFIGIALDIWREKLPRWMVWVTLGLSGLGALLSLYFAVILINFVPFGILGILFFGIGLVILAPYFTLQAFIRNYIRYKDPVGRKIFWAAVILPILFAGFYSVKYASFQHFVSEKRELASDKPSDLPFWIQVAQDFPSGSFQLDYLQNSTDFLGLRMDNNFIFGKGMRKGNPTPTVAAMMFGSPELNQHEATDVLGSLTDWRHESEPQLWSGNGLVTKVVESRVELMPEYRLAYVEKKLQIHLDFLDEFWDRGRREAIYTFHLPEGSCASSLSLWVNGKEEKARMDSKEKTTQAYEQIVGVESRDPSLVTWHAGNTVVVRVFPVTKEMDRVFKVGFTVPLKYKDGKLTYQNPFFEGPSFKDAEEVVQIEFKGNAPANVVMPKHLRSKDGQEWTFWGDYQPMWNIEFDAPALAGNAFAFEGEAWHLEPLKPTMESFQPQSLILDLDGGWSQMEINEMSQMGAENGMEVLAYLDGWEKVTAETSHQIFAKISDRRFSLIPFHEIPNPQQTLIVTRSTLYSPGWDQLSGEKFGEKLGKFLSEGNKVKVYHLGEELSPYLRTLKELHAIEYQKGTLDDLKAGLMAKQFPRVVEDANHAANHTAGFMIVKDSAQAGLTSTAPDHLMRLFAYQDVLRKAGPDLLIGKESDSTMVEEARNAYVVTPVTKLVVLETQQDYDRFGIRDESGTVGNAFSQMDNNNLPDVFSDGSGSVPEPHEWALIALMVLTAAWLYRKRMLARQHG